MRIPHFAALAVALAASLAGCAVPQLPFGFGRTTAASPSVTVTSESATPTPSRTPTPTLTRATRTSLTPSAFNPQPVTVTPQLPSGSKVTDTDRSSTDRNTLEMTAWDDPARRCRYITAVSLDTRPVPVRERANSIGMLSEVFQSLGVTLTPDNVATTRLRSDKGMVKAAEWGATTSTAYVHGAARMSRSGQGVAALMMCASSSQFDQGAWESFRDGTVFSGFIASEDFG